MVLTRALLVIFILTFFSWGDGFSQEQSYPNRQIEIVVPFSPGGTIDLGTRIISEELSKVLGVPVVVSNKAGGSGAAGAEYVAKARPDGYTLIAPSNTVFVTLPLTIPEITYKWTDFTPIMRIASIPIVLITKGDSLFNSMADIAAFARKNPGKLNIGIVGVASTGHFNFELWREKAGVDIGYIPYPGGGPLHTAQLGGHVDFASTNVPPIFGLVKSGSLKVLATTSKLKELPQVPTFPELGFPDNNIVLWLALFAPGKTPKEIVDKLSSALGKILHNPAVVEKMEKIGYTVEAMNATAFAGSTEKELKVLSTISEKMKKAMMSK